MVDVKLGVGFIYLTSELNEHHQAHIIFKLLKKTVLSLVSLC